MPDPAPVSRPLPRFQLRILVAEDHEVNRRLALLMLQKLGYHAEFVGNGREVIDALVRQPFDIILMDCQMPEMDGLAATRAIRADAAGNPGAAPVHIIAMTANAMRGDREICLAAGMDDYISKPVKLEALGQALETAALKLNRPVTTPPAPDSPAAPDLPPASHAALERGLTELVTEFGPEAAVELIESFLNDTPERLAELIHPVAATEPATLARIAHSIAGSSGIFGLEELRVLGLQIEDSIRANRTDEARRTILWLGATYDRLAPELKRQLARIRATI